MDELGDSPHHKFIDTGLPVTFHFDLMPTFPHVSHRFAGVRVIAAPIDYWLIPRVLVQKDADCPFATTGRSNENPPLVWTTECKGLARLRNRRELQQLRDDAVELFLPGKSDRCLGATCESENNYNHQNGPAAFHIDHDRKSKVYLQETS